MLEDLANITTIPIFTLKKLFNNLSLCIIHKVLENYLNKDCDTQVDIGIGKLSIQIISDSVVRYMFVPSYKFEQHLTEAIDSKKSPLIESAEEILVDKIQNTYKELM